MTLISGTFNIVIGIFYRNRPIAGRVRGLTYDEQAFALDAIMNPDIKLVTLQGVAGTGMPPWKALGDDAIWKVLIYERSFSRVQ